MSHHDFKTHYWVMISLYLYSVKNFILYPMWNITMQVPNVNLNNNNNNKTISLNMNFRNYS